MILDENLCTPRASLVSPEDMRTTLLALVFAVSACASGPRPVNVAAVRTEINQSIASSNGDRTVTSMGKTSTDHATVFTTSKAGTRQEETWVKANGSWKMENASAISNDTAASAGQPATATTN
jgi:hypothetical protein